MAKQLLADSIKQVSQVFGADETVLKLSLCCLMAQGHLLLEDLPGTGKTTLAKALAKVLGLSFSRVQFTSDLLPSDVVGSSIFDQASSRFVFQPGPVFCEFLLADEINRATAKTQSALLEAMAEKQVTVDGISHRLPRPFFVVATQNPQTQFGTYALPESQLDRFMVRLSLGYPSADAERAILKGETGQRFMGNIESVLSPENLQPLSAEISAITLSEPILDYTQALLQKSREHPQLRYGISPRGALALVSMAKAWAYFEGRSFVIPEDIQAVLPSVFYHRLQYAVSSKASVAFVIDDILASVAVN